MQDIKFNVDTLVNKNYEVPKMQTVNRIGIKQAYKEASEGKAKPPEGSLERIKTKLYKKFTKKSFKKQAEGKGTQSKLTVEGSADILEDISEISARSFNIEDAEEEKKKHLQL